MKFSFDLDGTSWKYRSLFVALASALKQAGHEVGVITAHGDELRAEDLRLWQARGFPEPDFFYNAKDYHESGRRDHRDEKLAFAEKVGIDCHVDDWDGDGILELVPVNQIDESHQ